MKKIILIALLILLICGTCYAEDRYRIVNYSGEDIYSFDKQTIRPIKFNDDKIILDTWIKIIVDDNKAGYDHVLIHTQIDFKNRETLDLEKIYYKDGTVTGHYKEDRRVIAIPPGTVWETVISRIYSYYSYQIKDIAIESPEWESINSYSLRNMKSDVFLNSLNISYDKNSQYIDCWIKTKTGPSTFITHLYINCNDFRFKEVEKIGFDYKGDIFLDDKPTNPGWIDAPAESNMRHIITNISIWAILMF